MDINYPEDQAIPTNQRGRRKGPDVGQGILVMKKAGLMGEPCSAQDRLAAGHHLTGNPSRRQR
ncbi:MAG: hypothetical protein U5J62_04775 [Desulfurivibrio sp.]|nr:hypothetical protein [Desulfurivibrio sp.]